MTEQTELLKFRILICFSKMSAESCTVTNLAKVLAVEKYTVSRAMIALEKEGLIDRSNNRRPRLTGSGSTLAEKYADRLETAMNHLIYEGVNSQSAQQDAMYLSMYCSNETFQVIQGMEERYRIKYKLKGRKQFDGDVLCRNLRDGIYQVPFVIYRENTENGNHMSMANEGFEHPCDLIVRKGKGLVRLRALPLTHSSAAGGSLMRGKIDTLKYYDGDTFCDTEKRGDFIQFPAQFLRFVNIGNSTDCIFHGSIYLKMTSSVGIVHMPESRAIFTLIL